VYGTRMDGKDSIVARIMRACATGSPFCVYGDGQQLRDYLHVSDAVASIELGLRMEKSTLLTIGRGESVSVNDLVRICEETAGVSLAVEHSPPRGAEMRAVIVDISKARAAGFTPLVGIRDGIRSAWADYVQNPWDTP
jgi:UDP-glucose 4-epimerase